MPHDDGPGHAPGVDAEWNDLPGEGDPRDGLYPDFDCERFELPWDTPQSCRPEGYTTKELEDLCEVPCVFSRDALPGEWAWDHATTGLALKFKGNVPHKSEWTDLIGCALALLRRNTRLIQFTMCALTGKPGAADCLLDEVNAPARVLKLTDAKPPDGAAAWVVSPTGIVLGAFGGFAAGGFLGSLWGALFGQLGSNTIVLFVESKDNLPVINHWLSDEQGKRDCACLALAVLLVHEMSHLCGFFGWKDVARVDKDATGQCFPSSMLCNSMSFLCQRPPYVIATGAAKLIAPGAANLTGAGAANLTAPGAANLTAPGAAKLIAAG